MTVKELYTYFDALFPAELSCEWDNDGLMCAAKLEKEVKCVLVTLDVTCAAVEYAIKNSFDAIISHHPLIFRPIGSVRADKNAKIIDLIKNDIAVMSFHTRLDAAEGGVNDKFADLLGLADTYAFGPEDEKMGRVGYTEKEMSLLEFAEKLKCALGCKSILTADSGRPVRKVAVLGGDGKDFVSAALCEGADTYVTGRMSYNIMVEAREKGINLVEAGHFFTEDHVCKYLIECIDALGAGIFAEHFCSNEIKIM